MIFEWTGNKAEKLNATVNVFYGGGLDKLDEFSKNQTYFYQSSLFKDGIGLIENSVKFLIVPSVLYLCMLIIFI